MAIRIREVNGKTVALCAAKTQPQKGDLYLDDNVHYALSTKFGLDFKEMGFLKNSMADKNLQEIMNKQEQERE